VNYLEPWYALPSAEAASLESELKREVGPMHRLRGVSARAIARRQDRDDVLYSLSAGAGEVAEVHLTWNEERDAEWPRTTIYPSLTEWSRTKMAEDNAAF
jgi:hypothetical protein